MWNEFFKKNVFSTATCLFLCFETAAECRTQQLADKVNSRLRLCYRLNKTNSKYLKVEMRTSKSLSLFCFFLKSLSLYS